MPGWLQWKMISVAIERRPEEVYDYAANPEHFPEWATSFCRSVRRSGDEWEIETAQGTMSLRFAERNPYGILDHYVRGESGPELLNPARVVADGPGSRVIFTVIQPSDRPDAAYAMDFRDAEQDLQTLKRVLERL
ncbi:SRPBCC family protein [Cohnella zeiphila]|uniref:SRPBCC family protein n=1 Tax=Cohnella zeiphila TaxID=2761120 RepID=A0A7X0VZ44_9BACL|nr:SRPBCC family protein [Cohnella zeiphila]MBB6735636.1 SRPBCC family protein [Cohnella zeiphila]